MNRDNRGFVEQWRRAGAALERIRREELRQFRHEDHVSSIDSLLDLGVRLGEPRAWSGLVEQQRLFTLARQRRAAGQ